MCYVSNENFQTLYYFDDAKDREPKGIIPLNNVQVRMCQDRSRSFCFELYRDTEVPMLTIKVNFLKFNKKQLNFQRVQTSK